MAGARRALAVAVCTAGLVLSAGVASADPAGTPLTHQQFLDAIGPVATATAAAEAPGWSQHVHTTSGSLDTMSSAMYDAATKRTVEVQPLSSLGGTEIAAVGTRRWNLLTASSALTRELALLGKRTPAYETRADAQAGLSVTSGSFSAFLTALTPATSNETASNGPDGSATYAGTFTAPTDLGSGTFALHVSLSGTLDTVTLHTVSPGSPPTAASVFDVTVSESTGPQTIPLPTVDHTVTAAALASARDALRIPADLSSLAGRVARNARTAAAAAHRSVRVSDVRLAASRVSRQLSPTVKAAVVAVPGGVTVSAVNRYSHVTTTYAVRVVGTTVRVQVSTVHT